MVSTVSVSMLRKQLEFLLDCRQEEIVERIAMFQKLVWTNDKIEGNAREVELLRDLAHDIDFFEPNLSARSEDPAFFGHRELRRRLEEAMRLLSLSYEDVQE